MGGDEETGSYPGQPWLWLYTLWYQVPGFDNSANVDLIAIYLTGAATILLLAVPLLPGLHNVPRLVPLHRLIWRQWYRDQGGGGPGASSSPPARQIDSGQGGPTIGLSGRPRRRRASERTSRS